MTSNMNAPGSAYTDSFDDTWAVVLAGGDGTRLRHLTTAANGVAVPKQFCCVGGDACLLEDSLARAAAVAPLRRTCAVVAAAHRRWWSNPLAHLLRENVLVQPRNRGTGVGILLSLLHILDRDPYANVVLLPSDHYLKDEATMALALRQAADMAAADDQAVYLLGAEPDGVDPDLGYIVPSDQPQMGSSRVARFVERPAPAEVAALLEKGALVNVSIVLGSVSALLRLYKKSHANRVTSMHEARSRSDKGSLDRPALSVLYEQLPSVDFSRDILDGQEPLLRVVSLPHCGWIDLGTPQRVPAALRALPHL